MTEEQPTARERLFDVVYAASFGQGGTGYSANRMVNAVLDNLPLVLEVAQEAGKAEFCGPCIKNGVQFDAWRLLSDSEEQT